MYGVNEFKHSFPPIPFPAFNWVELIGVKKAGIR
jgi:hypothetical protein